MDINYMLKKGWFFLNHKPIILKEEALEKMRFCIPGWLELGHIYSIDYVIKNLPSKDPILEIGTFAGLSTNVFLYFLNKYNKPNKYYTTDWFLGDISENEKIALVENPRDLITFLKESFIRNVNFFSPNSNIFSANLTSNDFFKAWENKQELDNLFGGKYKVGGPISFAYIDGNHKYDFAKEDFINVDKHLIKGGFILFDDSADYTNWGSKLVAQEAVKSGKYKVVFKNPHYLVEKI